MTGIMKPWARIGNNKGDVLEDMMEENLPGNVIFKLSPKGGKRINYVKNQCKGFTGRGRAYAKTLGQERAHFVPNTARRPE